MVPSGYKCLSCGKGEAGDRDVRASAMKAHRIIQKARAKMTPEARSIADEKARVILAEARRKARKLRP
jgi:hypothetical protein